jgi:hypothetical protein
VAFNEKSLEESMKALDYKRRVLLVAMGLVAIAAVARTAAAATQTLRVEALIDGRSQLILRGNTAQWFHLDWAAPGRHLFRNEPTVINGVAWFPVWPGVPDAENRDCHCYSDVFTGVDPPLPLGDMAVDLRLIQSRQTSILQLPTADNDFTLIVDFDDGPISDSFQYVVEIDITPRPFFAAFAARAALRLGPSAADDAFDIRATFTLGDDSDGVDPSAEEVRLQVGSYSATIPAGSFRSGANGAVEFEGVIDRVELKVVFLPARRQEGRTFKLKAHGEGAHLDGTVLPFRLALHIGDDQGDTTLDTVDVNGRSRP